MGLRTGVPEGLLVYERDGERRGMRLRRIEVIGVMGLSSTCACAQSFTFLGSPPGASFPIPRGVNDGGLTVVGQASAAGSPVAWRWTAGTGMQSLGFAGYALSVSADGNTVAGTEGISPSQAVRWTARGGVQGLGYASPSHTSSNGRAISSDGTVIVGQSFLGTALSVGYRWTSTGGMAGLGMLPGDTHSVATGVSSNGLVVSGTSYVYMAGGSYPQQAFRYINGTGMTGLGFLPGRNASTATLISGDGTTVIGGSYTLGVPGGENFRWTQGAGMQPLGVLPGFTACDAYGVNRDGTVVVGLCAGVTTQPFIWTASGGIRSLGTAVQSEFGVNLNGWQLTSAYAISPDGLAIVGTAVHPTGSSGVYLVTLRAPCYANCDGSSIAPVLSANDFQCFINTYAANDPYANCDQSTGTPALTANDFICFLSKFAAGCS